MKILNFLLIFLISVQVVSGQRGCFFSIKPGTIEPDKQSVINNFNSDSKDCILLFHPLSGTKLNIRFQYFQTVTLETDSCASSFTKIFTVDDSGERRKVAHYCKAILTDREIIFDTIDRVELVLIQSNFKLVYEYVTKGKDEEVLEEESDDVDDSIIFNSPALEVPLLIRCKPEEKDCSKESESTQLILKRNNIFTNDNNDTFTEEGSNKDGSLIRYSSGTKEDCERNLKFVCKSSRFCGHSKEDNILCNHTMYLCIDPERACDGIKDCLKSDSSDEFRCFFPYVRNSLFGTVALFVCCLTSVCFINHKTSLRKNNMVRFKGDVLKRKDVIKAKKNNIVERDSSNEIVTSSAVSAKPKSCIISTVNSIPKTPKVDVTTPTTASIPATRLPSTNSAVTFLDDHLEEEQQNGEEEEAVVAPATKINNGDIVNNDVENTMTMEEVIEGPLDDEEAEHWPLGYGYRFEYRNYSN